MGGLASWGTEAWGTEGLSAPAPAAALLALSEEPDATVLLEVEAYQGTGAAGSLLGYSAPWGTVAWGTGLPTQDVGYPAEKVVTLRYSDRGWIGDPDDPDRANVAYDGRLSDGPSIEWTLPIRRQARAALQFGRLGLDNGDGGLDSQVAGLATEGRPVRLYWGPSAGDFADFTRLATGRGETWVPGETVALGLRGAARALDTALVTERYGGTGGADGDAEIAGLTPPFVAGQVRNALALREEAAFEIYRLHARSIESVTAVRDNGVALTFDGTDYPDRASLKAATIASGYYATCLAEGRLRLGGAAAGTITWDGEGDAEGGYVSTTGEIATRLMREIAGVPATDIRAEAWRMLPAGTVGFAVPGGTETTVAAQIERLVAGVGGWWGGDAYGLFTAGYLLDPADQTTDFALTATDVIDVEPLRVERPLWRASARYSRNWTPQDKPGWTDAGPTVAAADTAALTRAPDAEDGAVIESLFASASDAQAVVDRLVALHAPRRVTYAVTIGWAGLPIRPGMYGHLTWPDFGLSGGLAVWCAGRRIEPDSLTLYLWG